jgi:hypothetical protein
MAPVLFSVDIPDFPGKSGLGMNLESLSFRDKFDILLETRLSGVAELRYIMVYGKSQIKDMSGDIMAWQRPDEPSTEQKDCLPILRSV